MKVIQFLLNDLEIDIRPFEESLYKDLTLRDYTINSLYFNVWENGILDISGGTTDLKNKILKTVNNYHVTYNFNSARFMRVCRFQVLLDFKVEENLM